MLFTESQLASNGLAVLDEAVYLTQAESSTAPVSIPVQESSALGANIVRFDDIHRLAESNGASYLDAMVAVAEASQIDPSTLKVAVDEAEIICNPDVVFALPEASVVVSGISENDPIFQFCEENINAFAESGDEKYLASILEADWGGDQTVMGPLKGLDDRMWGIKHHMTTDHIGTRLKNTIIRNPVKTGMLLTPFTGGASGLLTVYGSVKNVQKIYNKFKNRPRSVIAKKIASLRKLYETWLHRAKIEKNDKTAGMLKTIATNIMLLIDKLLELLQKGADKVASAMK